VVNYDNFYPAPDLADAYVAAASVLAEHHYESVHRYTTSAFMWLKLHGQLTERGLAPHIYESRQEALHRQITPTANLGIPGDVFRNSLTRSSVSPSTGPCRLAPDLAHPSARRRPQHLDYSNHVMRHTCDIEAITPSREQRPSKPFSSVDTSLGRAPSPEPQGV